MVLKLPISGPELGFIDGHAKFSSSLTLLSENFAQSGIHLGENVFIQ